MSSDWRCSRHGPVLPYAAVPRPSGEAVRALAARAVVPLWAPLPLPPGWSLTGLASAGDPRSGARATAVALSGPSPLGGPADLVLVAEEPGVGLGAHLAAGPGADPDLDPAGLVSRAPQVKLLAAAHPTPMWACAAGPERVAFVGEALGRWLWAVLWPPAAELLLLEQVQLHDLRHEAHVDVRLPVGAPSSRLC